MSSPLSVSLAHSILVAVAAAGERGTTNDELHRERRPIAIGRVIAMTGRLRDLGWVRCPMRRSNAALRFVLTDAGRAMLTRPTAEWSLDVATARQPSERDLAAWAKRADATCFNCGGDGYTLTHSVNPVREQCGCTTRPHPVRRRAVTSLGSWGAFTFPESM